MTDRGARLHFACTQCGACCNRAPEVELVEAEGLADVFIFQLMMRLYTLPARLSARDQRRAEKERLAYYAAHSWRAKRGGEPVDMYLTLSALALDIRSGRCPALQGTRCSIYARRPVTCRSVPVHYSRPEAQAAATLDNFVALPGHACDTREAAPPILADGRIVDAAVRQARQSADIMAAESARWKHAIVDVIRSGDTAVPDLDTISGAASYGASVVSMRHAWDIATATAVMSHARLAETVGKQHRLIRRTLLLEKPNGALAATLREMERDYGEALALSASRAPRLATR